MKNDDPRCAPKLRMNFSSRVLKFKKLLYQEGKEDDCRFLCSDGIVVGGSRIISFHSRFLETAIEKERNKQTGESREKAIELDYKIYSTKTIKVTIMISIMNNNL